MCKYYWQKEGKGMKSIAIITARSGSKGLKDKNIKLFNGKPLIWYTVQAAIKSKCFDEIMVSTDNEKYAKVARECGANVPFLRSENASSDTASSWEVVREVLKNYEKNNICFDNVMLLQPTSPLRTDEDIKNAFNLMKNKNADSVISVCEMEHSPLWSNTLPPDGCLEGFLNNEADCSVRQELPTFYRINGAIYLVKVDENIENRLYNKNSFAYVMSQEKSVDIDTELDFILAEYIYLKQNFSEEDK